MIINVYLSWIEKRYTQRLCSKCQWCFHDPNNFTLVFRIMTFDLQVFIFKYRLSPRAHSRTCRCGNYLIIYTFINILSQRYSGSVEFLRKKNIGLGPLYISILFKTVVTIVIHGLEKILTAEHYRSDCLLIWEMIIYLRSSKALTLFDIHTSLWEDDVWFRYHFCVHRMPILFYSSVLDQFQTTQTKICIF